MWNDGALTVPADASPNLPPQSGQSPELMVPSDVAIGVDLMYKEAVLTPEVPEIVHLQASVPFGAWHSALPFRHLQLACLRTCPLARIRVPSCTAS
ncbi:hypothetical protein HPB50_007615 [Hyalomma asiaticum]|uniref:Uncharacterized protein n=1 Tax=Hyalomma asiaticum TaxID=266040 RepID=A0ACB7SDC2_HYAAI|nr:hypothetical protein HPB50_007615 [Hyalomma asiaticum]